MGDTIYWLNIEIDVFWFNIAIMAVYLIWDNYFESIKTKLVRLDVMQRISSEELMKFFSPDKFGSINDNHAWVVDYNDVE
jgi:hypothetical protein